MANGGPCGTHQSAHYPLVRRDGRPITSRLTERQIKGFEIGNSKLNAGAYCFDQCGSAVRHFVTSSMHSTASSAVIR